MADVDDSKNGGRGKMPKGKPHRKSASPGEMIDINIVHALTKLSARGQ